MNCMFSTNKTSNGAVETTALWTQKCVKSLRELWAITKCLEVCVCLCVKYSTFLGLGTFIWLVSAAIPPFPLVRVQKRWFTMPVWQPLFRNSLLFYPPVAQSNPSTRDWTLPSTDAVRHHLPEAQSLPPTQRRQFQKKPSQKPVLCIVTLAWLLNYDSLYKVLSVAHSETQLEGLREPSISKRTGSTKIYPKFLPGPKVASTYCKPSSRRQAFR